MIIIISIIRRPTGTTPLHISPNLAYPWLSFIPISILCFIYLISTYETTIAAVMRQITMTTAVVIFDLVGLAVEGMAGVIDMMELLSNLL